MKAARQPAGFVVRVAQEPDGPAVAAFECSAGSYWEDEVEDFIRHRALAMALVPEADYRLLLVIEDGRLVGCIAHHREGIFQGGGQLVLATRLQLLALSRDDQGRRLGDGRRLSDLLMETLIFDALEMRDSKVLTAIVERSNLRSIRLCERNGLRSQIRFDSRHVRLSGHFMVRQPDGG